MGKKNEDKLNKTAMEKKIKNKKRAEEKKK